MQCGTPPLPMQHLLGAAFVSQKRKQPPRGDCFRWMVEVAGIEPASFDASPGLLRAQSAVPLLGPTVHANESVWRAQSLFGVPRVPATGTRSESSS